MEPPAQLSWRKNGKRLSNYQSRYLVKEFPAGDGLLLRIDPVRMGRDEAVYECVAELPNGEQVSDDASITVLESEYQLFILIGHLEIDLWVIRLGSIVRKNIK
jgi:receptor-type tyrosine-protein phosphatase F